MTNPKLLLRYFVMVPPSLRDRAYIAGGAVLDLNLANDVDIFILGCVGKTELHQLHAYVPDYDDSASSDKKAIMCLAEDGKPVNIICAEEPTITDLLEGFDISTSRWAISYAEKGYRVPTSTLPGKPITVFYLSPTTLQRVEKYIYRFGTGFVAGPWKE